ncbi:MAG: hypothetical protein ACI9MC_004166, partial [Kiritimatiellia bacterium]
APVTEGAEEPVYFERYATNLGVVHHTATPAPVHTRTLGVSANRPLAD